MNTSINAKLAAKKAAGINIHLFSDDHPETTMKGTGFKNAETAYRTIEIVKQKPRNRQVWTINAMYYRAKHHPNQTESMREAMEIYKSWLNQYNREKENDKKEKKNKERDRNKENTAYTTKINKEHSHTKRKFAAMVITEGSDEYSYNENNDSKRDKMNRKQRRGIKQQKINSSRSELEEKYKTLFNVSLPKLAKEEKWPIRLNHCLMRVALDAYWKCCWYEKLDQKKGALKSMSIPQIENVIVIGERMVDEGKSYVERLNKESLAYRGKNGPVKMQKPVKEEIDVENKKDRKVTKATKAIDEVVALVEKKDNKYDADSNEAKNLASRVPVLPVSSSNLNRATNVSSHNNEENKTENNNKNENGNSSDELNVDALLLAQRAISGRSTCRGCNKKIGKGEYRIGMKVWSSGRVITVWHRPLCFIRHALSVEKVTRGSSARCKYTGSKFQKGDLRVILQVGRTKSYYHALSAIKPLLTPVYDILSVIKEKDIKENKDTPISFKTTINGLDKLDDKDRASILSRLQ